MRYPYVHETSARWPHEPAAWSAELPAAVADRLDALADTVPAGRPGVLALGPCLGRLVAVALDYPRTWAGTWHPDAAGPVLGFADLGAAPADLPEAVVTSAPNAAIGCWPRRPRLALRLVVLPHRGLRLYRGTVAAEPFASAGWHAAPLACRTALRLAEVARRTTVDASER